MLAVRGRSAIARLAAALLASGLATAGSPAVAAGTAAPDEASSAHSDGGATATLGGLKIFDQAVIERDGQEQRVSAGLFEMSVPDGGTLKTYGIDIHSATQREATYEETSWDETSLHDNADAGKIRWILENSYPQVNDLAMLAGKAGAGALTEQTAAAGTQVAIWRYSDHIKVAALDPDAEKLADYLEKSAKSAKSAKSDKDGTEPTASLALSPPDVSGHAGELLGPITVRTDAASVTVTPAADAASSGVRIIDSDGQPVTTAADGSELYFEVPVGAADGTSSLTVSATTKVPVGRAFSSDTRSQTQILAGSSDSTVSATATANWALTGAVPALSARKNCAASGLDITAANTGDEEFTFTLMDSDHTIPGGGTRTVTIPLQEDQPYDFTITGPNGFSRNFRGVLDCRTSSSITTMVAGATTAPLPMPSAASVGGTGVGTDTATVNLADTGGSSTTPIIGAVALLLIVVGGATVFGLRRGH